MDGTGGAESMVPGSGGQLGGGAAPSACVGEETELPQIEAIPAPCVAMDGTESLETAEFCVSLEPSSQRLVGLRPKGESNFDYAPSDRRASRQGADFMHLGDVTARVRAVGAGAWQNVNTASSTAPVTSIDAADPVLAAADLGPRLPGDFPLTITRQWANEKGRLALRFSLSNTSDAAVEVGALGVPMVFNNIISGRSLEEAHATCSFSDPYIGNDGGYLQVTRLSGEGPALLVLPEGDTSFEAYNQILNVPGPDSSDPMPLFPEPTPRNQTFEGFHEWMIHSSAYLDDEWSSVSPWNTPTSLTLQPGESKTYGFRFVLSDEIRTIEDTLVREQRPLAVGLPGYILPSDLQGKLHLNYAAEVSSITVDPPGALTLEEQAPTPNCWKAYTVQGNTWGRARVTIDYADGVQQTVHYTVTKGAQEVVSDMGEFLTTDAWFVDPEDPFGRSPSVMTYDREENAVVTQSKQAWVCGLGDDGGATWLAGIMKLGGQPELGQIQKYEQFIDEVVWGGLQYSEGPNAYGVKRTLFYYEPGELGAGYYDPSIDWTTWMSWPRAHTEQVPRSYNYPHVAALYWTMYRLARTTEGLVTNHPWDWYLNQAYETTVAMTTIGSQYAEFGLMDGSVFLEILRDLQREEWTSEASDLEARMQARTDEWTSLAYPFGSEMAWDSTGQEEVYMWTKYFGEDDKAEITLNAILGYMPTVPHWGYNGSARRYWDFIYGGAKIDRLERMLHHYGSSLNAIPVLSAYRDAPEDFYLLRVGYGGMMGSLSNIDQEGFPSMGFHSFANTMKWDARTGDYGLNFYGHAYNAATYLVAHPEFGWTAFGGNVTPVGAALQVTPLDAFRQRVYIASLGLWLTLDAGRFQSVTFDPTTGAVSVTLDPADSYTQSAVLRVEQPGATAGTASYAAPAAHEVAREATIIPLATTPTTIELAATP